MTIQLPDLRIEGYISYTLNNRNFPFCCGKYKEINLEYNLLIL